MSEHFEGVPAPINSWLAMPLEPAARDIIERVRRADDVVHVAVMPDVHVANDVCVGTAMATRRLVYPAAVGGDIGCGMLAIGFNDSADFLKNPQQAGRLLRELGKHIPAYRRHRSRTAPFPADLREGDLSHPSLTAVCRSEGRLQLGTLGSGNHFIEFQRDESDQLWLMIHSGSRAMGQAIKSYHLAKATHRYGSLLALDCDTDDGKAYLNDQEWARRYATANRQTMAAEMIEITKELYNIGTLDGSMIHCDHNHVRREEHFGQTLLVHRKGAMPADEGLSGVVPGSMGTLSYHVEGKGCAKALHSSAHGAGRLLSRHAARERFTRTDLRRQMGAIWFDPRLAEALREESPRCYKDVKAVMRAQSELVAIRRALRPMLIYKGR